MFEGTRQPPSLGEAEGRKTPSQAKYFREMLCNGAPSQGNDLPGRISAGFQSGRPQINPPAGRW